MKILFGTLENGFPLEHVTDFDIRPDIILDENTRKYYKFYHAVGDDYYYLESSFKIVASPQPIKNNRFAE
jgi:hypothetical protein